MDQQVESSMPYEEAPLSYTHGNGEVFAAESLQEAVARCPMLGKLPLEQAAVLLQLRGEGQKILAEQAKSDKPEHGEKVVPIEPAKPVRSKEKSHLLPDEVLQQVSLKETNGTIPVQPMEHVVVDTLLKQRQQAETIEQEQELAATLVASQPDIAEVVPQLAKIEAPIITHRSEVANEVRIPELIVEPQIVISNEIYQIAAVSELPIAETSDSTISETLIAPSEALLAFDEPAVSSLDTMQEVTIQDSETVITPLEIQPVEAAGTLQLLNERLAELEPETTVVAHDLIAEVVQVIEALPIITGPEEGEPLAPEQVEHLEEVMVKLFGLLHLGSAAEAKAFTAFMLAQQPETTSETPETLFNYALSDYGTREGLPQFLITLKHLKKTISPFHISIGKLAILSSLLRPNERFGLIPAI